MNSSPIRELARRHAAGELSQEDYRAKRRELINEIVEGKRPLTYEQHRPPMKKARRSSKTPVVASAAMAFGIIAILIIWLAVSHMRTQPAKASHKVATAQASATNSSPGAKLVGEFLRTDDWSKSGIQGFIQKWNELPPKEQQNARNDYRYPRLVSELNQQIISQQAMSDLTKNKSGTEAELASLRKMADTLGIQTQSGE
ncbi:MAG TPA: SHOCT domain-containing protein [Pseudomonadales bacterium]|nr:SHOCT domain-containing protein [Pseudomonadales bacterium]